MTKMILLENKTFTSFDDNSTPIINERFLTDYTDVKKESKFNKINKFENYDISPKTYCGNSISLKSDKINIEKSEHSQDLSLTFTQKKIDNRKSKKKKVLFKDQIKISGNKFYYNNRLPLVEIINVESYKKFNSSNYLNRDNNNNLSQKFKTIGITINNFTCRVFNKTCCNIF